MTETTLHRNAQRVADILAERGVSGRVRMFAEPVSTAAGAAERVDCEVGAIANSLVFDADGEPVLILTSGAHRVETDRVAKELGADKVRRANPEFVKNATGQPIGGVAPVGHPAPIRTVVDGWLRRYDTVWAAAGHPNAVFPTTFDELVRLTGGTSADVGD